MDDNGLESTWNEQMFFSSLFFRYTGMCRYWQFNNDTQNWSSALLAKISMVLGVATDKEKNIFNNMKDDLIKTRNEVVKTHSPKTIGKLYNLCFKIESYVDTCANKHMPFLRVEKEYDVTAW